MKLLYAFDKIIGTADDSYSGPNVYMAAPEDFDINLMSDYVIVNGQLTIPPSPTQWLIDVGPFFDRFGAAKMPLLMSTNATVQALVKDLQVRKWIDLQRPDVGQGIDALIALGVPGVTAELKTAILTTPVTADENFALNKVYF